MKENKLPYYTVGGCNQDDCYCCGYDKDFLELKKPHEDLCLN